MSLAFTTGWPLAAPTVPFAIENEAGALPTIPPATATSFAFLTIVPTTSDQLTSGEPGSRLVGRNGWIQVKLWTPAGDRTDDMDALVEAVKSIFEMVNLAGPSGGETVDTRASSTDTIGTDGRWYMRLVRTPYTMFETK